MLFNGPICECGRRRRMKKNSVRSQQTLAVITNYEYITIANDPKNFSIKININCDTQFYIYSVYT